MTRKRKSPHEIQSRQVVVYCTPQMAAEIRGWAERRRVPVRYLVRQILEDALAQERSIPPA